MTKPLDPNRMKIEDGCLIWTGCLNSDGYPKITRGGNTNIKGHRYQYELHYGEIPEGVEYILNRPYQVLGG